MARTVYNSLKKWTPEGWSDPKKYIVLRGAGLWGICFIGAEVIDRALGQGNFKPDDMYKILSSGREWDWSNRGDFQGYSGRGGALKIRDLVVSDFSDSSGISIKTLFKEIMNE